MPVCADVIVLVLFGIGCMVEDWVLCAHVFIGKGSCRVEGWTLCANAFIGKSSCRVEDWVLCANVFIGKGSCRVGHWVPVCTDAIAPLGIGCRIEDWVPKGFIELSMLGFLYWDGPFALHYMAFYQLL